MPIADIRGLGQHGYMPDVAPSELPPTGLTYARNFRFQEGRFARVTNGYTNAFDTRNIQQFGNSNTDITFMYTWLLSNDNAIAYYDSTSNNMHFVENNTANNVVDFNLSVNDAVSTTSTYSASTPGAGEFTATTSTLTFNITGISNFSTAAVAGSEIITKIDGVTIFTRTITSNAVINGNLATVTVDTVNGGDIPTLTDGQNYQWRIGTNFEHDSASIHRWQATDAFGVPIFNNGLEGPRVFTDDVIPSIRPLDNFPSGATSTFITKFGAFIFALGYTNSAGAAGFRGNARTIAISDVITTPGTLPMWDFDNTESFSQIFDLSLYTDGDLVSAFESNNTLYVNTTTDVIAFVYEGNGQFNATRIPVAGGVLTNRVSTAIPNGFFNIGSGRIYIHDGNSFTEIGDGVWSDTWFNTVDEARLSEVQVVYDSREHSVWIKTPVSDTSQEMWIYNLNNKTLAVLDDHQEVRYITRSAEGVPAVNTTWDTFHPLDDTWNDIPQNSWNEFPILALGEYRDRILSCGGREFYVHDFGSTFNGRTINAQLQREYLKLTEDTYGSYTINRIIPWFRAPGNTQYSVRIGGASTTASETSFTPYQTYTVGTTEKLDFRRNVKWGAYTILSNTSGAEVSGLQVDVTQTNRR